MDILLVEDHTELAELIQIFLRKEGYSITHVESGEEAAAYLQNHTVKLLLLDVMLPGMDGFAVCREVRRKGSVPILIISARAGRDDKLKGFGLGADDYIEKPVDIELLAARVKALIQRTYGAHVETDMLVSGAVTIDKNARKAYLGGSLLDLNVKEFDLLLLLAENPGRTLRKEYLFSQVWGMDSFSESQTLTVHIKMLRAKIEDNPKDPKRIKTVWGVGYRYEAV